MTKSTSLGVFDLCPSKRNSVIQSVWTTLSQLRRLTFVDVRSSFEIYVGLINRLSTQKSVRFLAHHKGFLSVGFSTTT